MPGKVKSEFISKVRATLRRYRLIGPGGRVLLCVSGGADSMAMLFAMESLKKEFSVNLAVCHLNHNLRGAASRRDLEFVKAAAEGLGLGFEGRSLKAGAIGKGSVQEKARELRYRFFEEAAGRLGADRIATAHTLDDQAETVLMRFIKGSALKGLGGIPPARLPYIRPLIETTRGEVEDYLEAIGQGYRTDRSNLSTKYLRNDIRLRLIPILKSQYNPNIVEALGRTAAILRHDEEYLSKAASAKMKKAVVKSTKETAVLDRVALSRLGPAVSSRILIASALGLGEEGLYSAHLEQFLEMVSGKDPGASLTLPGGLVLVREYDLIVLSRKAQKAGAFDIALNVPGLTNIKPGLAIKTAILKRPPKRYDEGAAYFDYGALKGGLRARSWRPGDRMELFGGGHKKLKEVFIEKKIPKAKRGSVPVIVSGQDVLWAAGFKRSGLYKVGPGAKSVLKMELVENS